MQISRLYIDFDFIILIEIPGVPYFTIHHQYDKK